MHESNHKSPGLNWGVVRLNGSYFGGLNASINKALLHLCAVSSNPPLLQLKIYYKRKDSFVVGLKMTNMKFAFALGDLVNLAEDVMCFGSPQAAPRGYRVITYFRTYGVPENPDTIHSGVRFSRVNRPWGLKW